MQKVTHDDVESLIAAAMERPDLSAEDILHLTLARRLNNCSDNVLGRALGGGSQPPLNIWNRR